MFNQEPEYNICPDMWERGLLNFVRRHGHSEHLTFSQMKIYLLDY